MTEKNQKPNLPPTDKAVFFWVSDEMIEAKQRELQRQFDLIKKLGADTPEYIENKRKELAKLEEELGTKLKKMGFDFS